MLHCRKEEISQDTTIKCLNQLNSRLYYLNHLTLANALWSSDLFEEVHHMTKCLANYPRILRPDYRSEHGCLLHSVAVGIFYISMSNELPNRNMI